MSKLKELKPLEPTTIRKLMRGIDLERQRLIRLHEQRIKEIDAKVRSLQERCEHNWHHESDPSGNNDSFYECVVCGLETRSKP